MFAPCCILLVHPTSRPYRPSVRPSIVSQTHARANNINNTQDELLATRKDLMKNTLMHFRKVIAGGADPKDALKVRVWAGMCTCLTDGAGAAALYDYFSQNEWCLPSIHDDECNRIWCWRSTTPTTPSTTK